MKVSVIGTGYVGIVTAACLAEKGHQVVCVDVDEDKVARINRAEATIHEPGLKKLLSSHVPARLWAMTDLGEAVAGTDLSLICVGTPWNGCEADLRYVATVARGIGRALRDSSRYHVVVVKSTVPPGTTDRVVRPILEEEAGQVAGQAFGIGMNPEFLTEGEAVENFLYPDRIVIGGMDERTRDVVEALYVDFPDTPRLRTDNATAEMIKYASNALLATMISFSNELANLSEALGTVDIAEALSGVHLSRYLSPSLPNGERVTAPIASFLWAGCGFGGSCLPKDVKALIAHGAAHGCPMPLLGEVLRTNERQPHHVVRQLSRHYPSLKGVRTAVLGLAFRPGTDDMRESPAIPIIEDLLAQQAEVRAYDPAAGAAAREMLKGRPVAICGSIEDAIDGAKIIVIVTRWEEFKKLPELIAQREPAPLVYDGRRMLDRHTIRRYDGVGCIV
jgi:UDPglucose 6-dehydrogenase/GDP-mannose 6-dehydrogenase